MEQKTPGNGGPDRPARHTGARKRARAFPKGRQLDTEALEEIRALLGDRPRRHDLLIEYLHLIQDRYHAISARHLKALCEELRLPQAAAYECATFYAHFDVVKEGETPPPPTTVRICDSITCAIKGAASLYRALKSGADPSAVRVLYAPCMGRCDMAPVAEIGHLHVDNATPDSVKGVVASGKREPVIPPYESLAAYRAKGGYKLLERCLAGKLSFDAIIKEMTDAGLRGLGGAGFPAGRKWQIVRSYPGPRLMTVNGDEGEPGTFKDRYYLERNPHQMLEGALIAAWAVEAERIYIYMRDEYPAVLHILAHEIAALEQAGIVKDGDIELRRGAGAYICGEESAMIESIEGKRGYPRNRPPYIAEVGLFGRPTLNHNVETLYWVPEILEKGAKWFADHGVNGAKGLRSWSVSGRVKKPGVILAPAGITARELIEHGRRHGGWGEFQGLSAGRRLGRHSSRRHGRHPARFRHLGQIRLLRRQPRHCRLLRARQGGRHRHQSAALLQGRVVRTMHAVPGRLRQGGGAARGRGMGQGASDRARPGHARRFDLRAGTGGAQRLHLGHAVLLGRASPHRGGGAGVTLYIRDGGRRTAEDQVT